MEGVYRGGYMYFTPHFRLLWSDEPVEFLWWGGGQCHRDPARIHPSIWDISPRTTYIIIQVCPLCVYIATMDYLLHVFETSNLCFKCYVATASLPFILLSQSAGTLQLIPRLLDEFLLFCLSNDTPYWFSGGWVMATVPLWIFREGKSIGHGNFPGHCSVSWDVLKCVKNVTEQFFFIPPMRHFILRL